MFNIFLNKYNSSGKKIANSFEVASKDDSDDDDDNSSLLEDYDS